jgi:hypothetical protein
VIPDKPVVGSGRVFIDSTIPSAADASGEDRERHEENES